MAPGAVLGRRLRRRFFPPLKLIRANLTPPKCGNSLRTEPPARRGANFAWRVPERPDRIGGLINELEKAHIYIERLNEETKLQKAALAGKDRRLAQMDTHLARFDAMERRIAQLEASLANSPRADD